ncbi:hypothetical protein Pdw03_5248 [Penicillium digitatum]|uniref:Uncharacterized protein n=1 Tax=Penicillium digitatum TaxID=36651 RepID=A0A7T6XUI1_PENDI|nr:hypothetical protein Pdw03_5248 [Penicillium digitatum]
MSNDERSVALAIENEILLAVVEINKWQHIIQDRRLALQRITHEAEVSNHFSDAVEDNESLLTMGSYPKARRGSRRLSTPALLNATEINTVRDTAETLQATDSPKAQMKDVTRLYSRIRGRGLVQYWPGRSQTCGVASVDPKERERERERRDNTIKYLGE